MKKLIVEVDCKSENWGYEFKKYMYDFLKYFNVDRFSKIYLIDVEEDTKQEKK